MRGTTLAAVSIAALAACLGGCGGASSSSTSGHFSLRLAGAQIPVELVTNWVQNATRPDFRTIRVDPVYLSQHGFKALLKGEADIACTDRPLTRAEAADFAAAGKSVEGYRVGFYGYAFYVHPSNPLDSLYAGHIRYLFQKKITTWPELASRADPRLAGPIRLIGPQKSTRGGDVLMRQGQIWFANPTWEPMDSDAAIVDAVAADPTALGFASIGMDQGVRYLGLRMERNSPPAFPSLEEIESESYGLAKVIYIYAPSPLPDGARALLEFLQSDAGHAAIRATDLWPVAAARGRVAAP
jgi:phosphate transport system substrate-binding protein